MKNKLINDLVAKLLNSSKVDLGTKVTVTYDYKEHYLEAEILTGTTIFDSRELEAIHSFANDKSPQINIALSNRDSKMVINISVYDDPSS